MTKENQRNSYTITIRASIDDTNTIELIDYLKAIGRPAASKKIEDLLMVGLLALAKKHSGKYTAEQLTLSCLESCNNLSNYASFLRQAFGVVDPYFQSHLVSPAMVAPAQLNNAAVLNGVANVGNTASLPASMATVVSTPVAEPTSTTESFSDREDEEEPDFDEVFGD